MAIHAYSRSTCWFAMARPGARTGSLTASRNFGDCWHGWLLIPGCDTLITLTGLGPHSAGREELFERERHTKPVPGWHTCVLACAELEEAI